MKFIIEMSEQETKDVIANGSLMAMLEKLEPSLRSDATQETQPVAVVQQVPMQPAVQTVPTETTAPETPSEQAAPTVQTVTPVVTTAREYTLDDLAAAAMTLMDKGMQPQLQELLKNYGVEAMPQLPKEQYGAFATALRGMGAQI